MESFRWELLAHSVGARVVLGMLDAGRSQEDLDKIDLTHINIEHERIQTNAGRKDPFDPNATLINHLKEIGIDVTLED